VNLSHFQVTAIAFVGAVGVDLIAGLAGVPHPWWTQYAIIGGYGVVALLRIAGVELGLVGRDSRTSAGDGGGSE